jgi:hypothetical protein
MKNSMPAESLFAHISNKAAALGKSFRRLICDSVRKVSGSGSAEHSIKEFERLSGTGHSNGWRFDRDEVHQRRDRI